MAKGKFGEQGSWYEDQGLEITYGNVGTLEQAL